MRDVVGVDLVQLLNVGGNTTIARFGLAVQRQMSANFVAIDAVGLRLNNGVSDDVTVCSVANS